VSSAYRALCLLHPRAQDTGVEFSSAAELEGALANRANHPVFTDHVDCDLVGGRYSYPLIEVYCPGHSISGHREGEWTDQGWLALLLAATDASIANAALVPAVRRASPCCWTPDRIERLRPHLRIGVA
jgi:hypothetical protein